MKIIVSPPHKPEVEHCEEYCTFEVAKQRSVSMLLYCYPAYRLPSISTKICFNSVEINQSDVNFAVN